jgi:hypothetical protein
MWVPMARLEPETNNLEGLTQLVGIAICKPDPDYSNDGQKMDRRTLASRSQEVDRRHDEGVSKPAGRFPRYNTTPEVG